MSILFPSHNFELFPNVLSRSGHLLDADIYINLVILLSLSSRANMDQSHFSKVNKTFSCNELLLCVKYSFEHTIVARLYFITLLS